MRHGKGRFIVGFLAPGLVLYVVFVLSPFVQAFHYSLTDWTGVTPEFSYIGLDNFRRLLDDSLFLAAMRNNIVLLVVVPLATVFLALLYAFLLNVGGSASSAGVKGIRGNGFYKLTFFMPQVLSIPVIAVIWSVILEPTSNGLVNSVLGLVGIGPSGFLSDPDLALWCVMWVLVWGSVGFYLVLFNAAISSVPREIFEAAVIDGAGRLSTFVRVTLPLLWDTVQTAWVYLAILALDVYALVAVMTAGPGGPDNSTQVMSLQIAQNGFQFGRAGYASAMGVVLFVLTLVIAAFMLRISRRDRVEF
ncbi:carbohydrate ABC transporter permease [Nocardioides sp. GXQ0305]|uniref:carbohydrate ABC transporter permease n=1 Tax=Nocardioides sp. GXQ0305 TaxID=3423912 RepID=UPI003D7C6D7E